MATPDEMMAIGREFVACCSEGRVAELQQKHYAQNAVSVEAAPMPDGSAEAQGLEAIQAKNEWWFSAHDVHEMNVEGPFVHGRSVKSVTIRFAMVKLSVRSLLTPYRRSIGRWV